MADRKSITAERLRELMTYNPETGQFIRRVAVRGNAAACVVGARTTHGYWSIQVDYRMYYAHRLAYLYMAGAWPPRKIDHRDGNRCNNAWRNLRRATDGQNALNSAVRSDNTSGFKGVSFVRGRGDWAAYINVNKRRIHLGYFGSKESAAAAYGVAALEHHGEFARTK